MITSGMFSSMEQDYATPTAIFKYLDREFHFTLDACANENNAKCSAYFTEETDGLSQSWSEYSVFMNSPYNQNSLWIEKAYNESLYKDTLVVALIPARTDTWYWHKYCMKADELRFIRGRLKFDRNGVHGTAPFPSVIVVFKGQNVLDYPRVVSLDKGLFY